MRIGDGNQYKLNVKFGFSLLEKKNQSLFIAERNTSITELELS